MSQRFQAARDRGEVLPYADSEEVGTGVEATVEPLATNQSKFAE